MTWWQYALIGFGIIHIIRAVAKTLIFVDQGNEDDLHRAREVKAWSKPALPRPKILPGKRTEQGVLVDQQDRFQMLCHWDRTKVFDWLDTQSKRVRPIVTNEKILAYVDELTANPKDRPDNYYELANMVSDYPRDEWGEYPSPHYEAYQLFAMVNARHCLGSYGYAIAFFRLGKNGWDIPHDICIALNRLAADKEFNPAIVNMWGYISENNLALEEYVDIAVQELYLRHSFELGSCDGHYHIATQVLDFYINAPYQRQDDGFVAAAMARVRQYDPDVFDHYLHEIKLRKLDYDLSDKSISRIGLIQEMAARETTVTN